MLIQRAAEDAVDYHPASSTRQIISTRLEVLETNWNKFQTKHDSLCQGEFDPIDEDPYIRNKTFERCQEFYIQARAALLSRQDDLSLPTFPSRSSEALPPNVSICSRRSSLPRISLPHFSGDYHTWRSFHDLFSSIVVNNSELTDVERMHYLKTSLSGEAAQLVINLPVSGDTFALAWETLIARYENKRVLISAQLDKLFNIKPLQTKSAHGLRMLLATVIESTGALRALSCPMDAWDSLLLHFLVRRLDPNTREAWEMKHGSSTSYPTFTQFEEFVVGRSRALENLEVSATGSSHGRERSAKFAPALNSRAQTLVAAASSTTGEITCRLCGASHYISACSEYLALNG